MTWPERTVNDWAELASLFEDCRVGRTGDPSWYFRGQADARWSLEPSLLRLLDATRITHKKAHGIEFGVFRRFMRQANLHFPGNLPSAELGPSPVWWMLMQHYHAPTRLLDWTESPYVAAYYAVERSSETDGAVWVMPASPLQTQVDSEFGDMRSALANGAFSDDAPPQAVYPICPVEHNARSVAQQGSYTVSVDILADHATLIEAALARTRWSTQFVKLVVPSTLKTEFLCRLHAMNIAASALFPGPDGVGRAAAEYVKIRVWDQDSECGRIGEASRRPEAAR